MFFVIFAFRPVWLHLANRDLLLSILDTVWGHLGPCWAHRGPMLRQSWALLDHIGPILLGHLRLICMASSTILCHFLAAFHLHQPFKILDASGAILEPFGTHVGPSWELVWHISGPIFSYLGTLFSHLSSHASQIRKDGAAMHRRMRLRLQEVSHGSK